MERFTPLDKVWVAVVTVASTPIICAIVRPDLFVEITTNPLFLQVGKLLLIIFGS